ncbi:DUF2493 domain-containing protein [Kitasatospora sp. NPDC004289]
MTRVLVTGARNWPNPTPIRQALDAQLATHGDNLIIVVGDCPTGADHHARQWATDHRVPLDVHIANWNAHGPAAGPLRNHAMVAAGADLCLAFPLGRSPGTRNCMRRATAAGIPVHEPAEVTE